VVGLTYGTSSSPLLIATPAAVYALRICAIPTMQRIALSICRERGGWVATCVRVSR
jgi:hypothetical protein